MVSTGLRARVRALVRSLAVLVLLAVAGAQPAAGGAAQLDAGRCADVVLRDWADGSLDRAYEPDCYLEAIDSLPEELRVYTSAEEDVTRALRSAWAHRARAGMRAGAGERRLAAAGERPVTSTALREPPGPLVLVACIAVVLGGAIALAVVRRARA